MQLSSAQRSALLRPLLPQRVSTRSQSGRSLSYLEQWDVRAMLIRVFGFTGFDIEVLETETFHTSRAGGDTGNWTIGVKATVRLTIHNDDGSPTVYTEAAAASQTGPQVGEVMDFAIKTAASDAMKRCAMNLGTQFGLSLYAGRNTDVVRQVVAPGYGVDDTVPDGEVPEVSLPLADGETEEERAARGVADQRIERATAGAARRAR